MKDSTKVQSTEHSVSLSLDGCGFPGSHLEEDVALVVAGHSQHAPELPESRNGDMYRKKGKASSALGWLCCVRQRTSQPSVMETGPQHVLLAGPCSAATTEKKHKSVKNI